MIAVAAGVLAAPALAAKPEDGKSPVGGPGAAKAVEPSGPPPVTPPPPTSKRRAYVIGKNASTITALRLDGSAGGSIPVGTAGTTKLAGIAITPDARRALVTDPGTDGVYPVDLAAGTAGPKIDTLADSNPGEIAIAPDGSAAFVSADAKPKKKVCVIPLGTLVPACVDLSTAIAHPGAVAVSPDGGLLLIADHGIDGADPKDPGRVYAYTVTGTTLAPASGSPIDVGSLPRALGFAPDGKSAYVVGAQELTIVDPATRAIRETVTGDEVEGGGALALAPDGKSAWVVRQFGLRLLQRVGLPPGGTPPPALTLPTDGGPLALTPDGGRALVTLPGSGRVADVTLGRTPAVAGTLSAAPLTSTDGIAIEPNQGPTASFTVVPAPPGAASAFDATASRDPDGVVTRYDWDFGDGAALPDGGPTPRHVYAAPGSYVARLTVTDNEGTSTTRSFTGQTAVANGGPSATAVQVVSVQTLAVPPDPAPRPAAQAITVERVTGTVKVKLPGSSSYVAVETLRAIPTGSTVDTTKGKARIRVPGDKPGTSQASLFYEGLFLLRRPTERVRGVRKTLTELVLKGDVGPCGGSSARKADAAAKRKKKRRLWGDGSGSFRTKGKYSSATVRGTKWLVEDTCAGTRTIVKRGVVTVRDLVRKKDVTVRQGKSYLARPK